MEVIIEACKTIVASWSNYRCNTSRTLADESSRDCVLLDHVQNKAILGNFPLEGSLQFFPTKILEHMGQDWEPKKHVPVLVAWDVYAWLRAPRVPVSDFWGCFQFMSKLVDLFSAFKRLRYSCLSVFQAAEGPCCCCCSDSPSDSGFEDHSFGSPKSGTGTWSLVSRVVVKTSFSSFSASCTSLLRAITKLLKTDALCASNFFVSMLGRSLSFFS